MPENNTMFLVDGSSLAFRSFFALLTTGMRNAEGMPTWAVYGFFASLFDLIEKHSPHSMAVCFDLAEPTFRHEQFEDYKAHRDEMPDDLASQWPLIKEAVQAFHIPLYELAGWEADDIIGTVAKQGKTRNLSTVILTGDQDAFQLLDEHIEVLMPTKEGLKTYHRQEVFDKLGVWPEQITDYKGLCGDNSDNIPGVKGIGPKTAVALLSQYQNIEGIYEHIDEIKSASQKTKLIEGKDKAYSSRMLATIVLEVPLDFDFDHCQMSCPPIEKITEIFRHLELRNLLKRLPKVLSHFNNGVEPEIDPKLLQVQPKSRMKSGASATGERLLPGASPRSLPGGSGTAPSAVPGASPGAPSVSEDSSGEYTGLHLVAASTESSTDSGFSSEAPPAGRQLSLLDLVNTNPISSVAVLAPQEHKVEKLRTRAELEKLIEELRKVGNFCLALRTSSESSLSGELHGIAFCYSDSLSVGEDQRLVLNDAHVPARVVYVPLERAGEAPLSREEVLELFKPLLEDAGVAKIAFDAKFAMNAFSRYQVKLEGIVFDPLLASYIFNPDENHKLAAQTQAFLARHLPELPTGGARKSSSDLEFLPMSQLAQVTGEEVAAVHDLTSAFIKAMDDDQRELLWGMDLPLSHVLATMEQNGVMLDLPYFKQLGKEMTADIGRLEKEIHDLAGHAFNVGSPIQLQKILFEELKLPAKVKTKSGYSTDAAVLEALADSHPIVNKILEYRHATKLSGTYVEALPKLVSKRTGRLHGEFNQASTATGRLSSTNPNLQNIPIRSELGRRIRGGFIGGDSESSLISADYSQIELRLLAHMSGDEKLIEAFKADEDVHARTAALIFDVPVEQVNSEQRGVGKTLNFALIYQQGAFATGQSLGISTKEAQGFIDRYFESFPKVKAFMNRIIGDAKEAGFVQTLWGRRRYFNHLNDRNEGIRKADERAAFNAPLQGSAADLMKLAMIKLQEELKSRGMKSKLILQVHDELVLDVPADELKEAEEVLVSAMTLGEPLKVPLKVGVGKGKNWKDAK